MLCWTTFDLYLQLTLLSSEHKNWYSSIELSSTTQNLTLVEVRHWDHFVFSLHRRRRGEEERRSGGEEEKMKGGENNLAVPHLAFVREEEERGGWFCQGRRRPLPKVFKIKRSVFIHRPLNIPPQRDTRRFRKLSRVSNTKRNTKCIREI